MFRRILNIWSKHILQATTWFFRLRIFRVVKYTYNFSVTIPASLLKLCYSLMQRSVSVQCVLHFTVSAVLLEHIFLFKLLLLWQHHPGQLEQQPDDQEIKYWRRFKMKKTEGLILAMCRIWQICCRHWFSSNLASTVMRVQLRDDMTGECYCYITVWNTFYSGDEIFLAFFSKKYFCFICVGLLKSGEDG